MSWSYYPMNLDMLYMIALYAGSDIIPKFIHFTFALLTSWLIFSHLKKREIPTNLALAGSLLFITIPVIIKLSITAYVDLGLIFFSTASLISLLNWADNGFKIKHIIISGISCGLAMGTKYNGLIIFMLMVLFIPWIYSKKINFFKNDLYKKDQKPAFHYLAPINAMVIFSLAALILFSPWMIRNIIWKGNPLYPLYQNVFPSKNDNVCPVEKAVSDMEENKPFKFGTLLYRKMLYNESIVDIMMLPARIFFQGEDDNPALFDGRLTPLLFFLPFFAFFKTGTKTDRYQYEKYFFFFLPYLFCCLCYLPLYSAFVILQ
ncbi:ArnT family glycosyltransferase [Desulfamplus magnetovallimortis]|nr:phospholipid carrier-dependent glycosyltransferase [Desulfamplus magnetovallimortis]